MGKRTFGNGKGAKVPTDTAGHSVVSLKDIKVIEDLQKKRYNNMMEQFKQNLLDELKLIHGAKRSRTDKAALEDAIYLKAKEKYAVMSSNELWDLYKANPEFKPTPELTYPEIKALFDCWSADYNKQQKELVTQYGSATLEELEKINTDGFTLAQTNALKHLLDNAAKVPEKPSNDKILPSIESIGAVNDNRGNDTQVMETGIQPSSDSMDETRDSS